MGPTSWWRSERGDLLITVRVQPNARRNEVVGVVGDALRLKIAAPPTAGKANEALRRYVAELFGIRRSAVRVRVGATDRNKVVQIVGLVEPPASLGARLGRRDRST